MISLRTSSSSLLAVLAASTGLLVACDADPIGGGSGGGGGDDDTTVVSTSTGTNTGVGGNGAGGGQSTTTSSTGGGSAVGGGPAASESIALYGDELPDVGSGGGSSSVGAGGSDPGYDDHLYLFVSRGEVACSDPFAVDEACPEVAFKAIIGLPPEYQQAGTYELGDPAIISNFSEWGPNGDGSCYGGGGSFFDGTIEVVSIEADRVRLILDGTSPAGLDGQHAAFFCGDDPPPPEESSVIGYFPSDLPPPESGSSGVGGNEDDRFTLVFADHAQSCADPFGNQPGPGETHHELVMQLPDAYLAPGTYDLADPLITVNAYEFEENTAAVGGGNGIPGTLTIHEVTATTVDLELSGTQYDFANVAAVVPRCGG